MKKCYNCETDLTELTESSEHIIPNSIGGKIKSVRLLCRDCNTLFGETIDNEPVHHANIHSIQTWLSRLSITIDNLHAEKSMGKILAECMEEVNMKYTGTKTFSTEMMDDYIQRVSFRMAVLIDHINNRKA